MKIAVTLSAILLLAITGCTHTAVIKVTPVIIAPTSGARTITYLLMNDTDMTQHLAGYTFNFNPDGSLIVFNGLQNLNGTWTQIADDSNIQFTMNVPDADPMLAQLNDEFVQKVNTDTELELQHDHESENHHIKVHFTKQ